MYEKVKVEGVKKKEKVAIDKTCTSVVSLFPSGKMKNGPSQRKHETPVPCPEEPPYLLRSMIMEVLNKRRKLEESSSSNLKESSSNLKRDPVAILQELGNIPYSGIKPIKSCQFMAKVGLHCYNFHMETKLQFLAITSISAIQVLYRYDAISLDAFDPAQHAITKIKTFVWDAPGMPDLTLVSRSHTLERSNDSGCCLWDPDGVDVLYKGDMPKWLHDDALADKLHYYELNESDLLENHDWLHLYAQVGAYAKWDFEMFDFLPLEINKAVVQTNEDLLESSMKLKSRDAIFYIIFETRRGVESKCVIRQTNDGKPQHMCLEVSNVAIVE